MLVYLLTHISVPCFSQPFPDLQFEHLTIKDGLSSDAVNGITEDKTGFLWVGTSNGLNRYNGYGFKKYFHDDEDSNSLIHNSIQSIYCDSRNRLWICTVDGVSCFLPKENRFINYHTRFSDAHKIKNNNSVTLYEDETGTDWICNQGEYIFKVKDDLSLERFSLRGTQFTTAKIKYSGYSSVFRDRHGDEWGYMFNHIYKLNKKTKQPEKSFIVNTGLGVILQMMQDEDGAYRLGTWGYGAYIFNPEKGDVQMTANLPKNKIISNILEWGYHGNKWRIFLERNGGVYLANAHTAAIRNYSFIADDPTSLRGNIFSSVFKDRHNNVWIGSNMGIQKITAQQNSFTIYPVTDPGSNNYEFLKSGVVFSYLETDSSIWLAKRFVSTFRYDTNFVLRDFYPTLYPLSKKANAEKSVAYYFLKNKDNLLISVDGGLVILQPRHQKSTLYFPPAFSKTVDFRTIIPLGGDEVLIRSYSFGLFTFNCSTLKFTKWYSNKDTCTACLPVNNNYLFKSRGNGIYVSTGGKGLFQYHKAIDKFLPVVVENGATDLFQKAFLYGIDEDKQGKLWILSTNGIYIYNAQTASVEKHITEKGKLGALQRICFDDDDNAWVTGASGIWCYLRNKDKWINFNEGDGLPGSDFETIIAKRKNGDIVAGLEGAIAVFHPQQMLKAPIETPTIITEVFVGNREFPLSLQTNTNKQIKTRPGETSISVDFVLLNYLNPASNRYYYRIEPLMTEFLENKDGHLNFTGLSPGMYTLHVKGGDKAGNFFVNEDMLRIYVEPYWYQAKWFKGLIFLLGSIIIFYFVKRRIMVIRKEAAIKQKIAETEMQALRAQMNPHFIFNSLNSIENFIMRNDKRLASDYLNKFASLTRTILDSSQSAVVPFTKDIEALQLYIDLEQLRFNNKFKYETCIDPELLNGDYRLPSLLIQPYVENAIVHGLAHSEEPYLYLLLTATLENDRIKFIVEDNGVGRKQAGIYNEQNKPGHKSTGLKITEDRINIFNADSAINNPVKFTDMYDEQGVANGTRVEITIKAI